MSAPRAVVVFGGTGFLGRRIVRHVIGQDLAVRIVARHPDRAMSQSGGGPGLQCVAADIADASAVAGTVTGAFAVVNAVSLYVERGSATFRAIHVDAAAAVAECARRSGVTRLVHVSGIGADPAAASPYIRSRGEGEDAVRRAFPDATIVRPAVMFGRNDAFLSPLIGMVRRLPVFPLFGRGDTKLQPAWVDDVAEAIARIVATPAPERLYEFAGPDTFAYAALVRLIATRLQSRPALIPVPFTLWRLLAFAAEALPRPPITRNQVELMMHDTIASPARPGFRDLGIAPRGIASLLESAVAP